MSPGYYDSPSSMRAPMIAHATTNQIVSHEFEYRDLPLAEKNGAVAPVTFR